MPFLPIIVFGGLLLLLSNDTPFGSANRASEENQTESKKANVIELTEDQLMAISTYLKDQDSEKSDS